MKIKLVFFIFICIIVLIILFINGEKILNEINYSKLGNEVKITGSLGHALGEIIKIEGIGVTDNSKENSGKILLKVIKVNDSQLKNPVIIQFYKFSFSSIKELKENDPFKYKGYETGGMAGIPDKAFELFPYVTTSGYGFSVYFQVCVEEK